MQALQDIATRVYQSAREADGADGWGEDQDPAAVRDALIVPEPDPLPDCPLCRNFRKIRLDVEVGDPRFGKLFDCPKCAPHLEHQRQQRRWAQLAPRLDQYGIIPRADATFESFNLGGRSESVRKAFDSSLRFAELSGVWLVLYGESGTGKTHLAMAVANAVRARRQTCLLATVPGWLDLLKSGFDSGDFEELMDLSLKADYLIFDDLGTQKATDWAYERLFHVLNTRYNERKPVLITMNLVPSVLDMRLSSRMMDKTLCKIIHVVDSDYRPQKGAR